MYLSVVALPSPPSRENREKLIVRGFHKTRFQDGMVEYEPFQEIYFHWSHCLTVYRYSFIPVLPAFWRFNKDELSTQTSCLSYELVSSKEFCNSCNLKIFLFYFKVMKNVKCICKVTDWRLICRVHQFYGNECQWTWGKN